MPEDIIYGLFDPNKGVIMYVGKTAEPKRRLRRHVNMATSEGKTKVQHWVKELVKDGRHPSMILLQNCGSHGRAAIEIEKDWIEAIRLSNPDLTNAPTNREERGRGVRTAKPAIVSDATGNIFHWPKLKWTKGEFTQG